MFDRPIVKQLYLLAKLPRRLMALSRKKAFDRFTAKYLRLTRRYNSYEELKADAPEADAYIAGSDQIWNTLFPNGRDAAFYLDLANRMLEESVMLLVLQPKMWYLNIVSLLAKNLRILISYQYEKNIITIAIFIR